MILAIESSCDDSSISITKIDTLELVFHKKISQEIEHSIYGGVVPELAARLHIEALPKILEECKEYLKDLKAVAVTNAPGLSVTLTEGLSKVKECPQADLFLAGATTVIFANGAKASIKAFNPTASNPSSFVNKICFMILYEPLPIVVLKFPLLRLL
jgi:hypothetical protein